MKFLLVAVNAKYIHSNPAVYSLYAYARKEYEEMIGIAEYTINQKTEEILAQIYAEKPDAIGLSCYIWNWNMICDLLSDLSKVLPDAHIWLGGPQVSYNAPSVLAQFPFVKGIMVGEGEVTFCKLLEHYQKGNAEDFSDVAGLCLASGFTQQRETTDLSNIPFLYEDTAPFANRIIYYESSRGCPYRCSYCLSSIDKKVRLRDIELVKKELDFFLDAKVSQVKFVDRTFNCVHEHAMAIWQYLSDHDNGITNFHFEISADIIKDEEIALLQKLRPGQVQLEIGVQSANDKTLEAINRKMDLGRLARVVAKIKEGGNIHQHLDLIAGLPYEDYDSFGRSFDRVYAMAPDQLQLGFLKVLAGAPIAEKTEEFGIAYTKQPPYEVLYTKWLPFEDVIRLKRIEEMVELYYNSNQFLHTLRFLEGAFSSPFAMFEALAEFYREQGLFTNSPSRVYRYEVLLQFAGKVDPGQQEIYTELLTYDLYLRENMKSRPAFCRSLQDEEYKGFRREFYRKEEQSRNYLPELEEYDARQLSGMTHLEPFVYPVWDPEKITACRKPAGRKEKRVSEDSTVYMLFHYGKRNPLTREAATYIVSGG
ncbi:MAG: B12-binding domain-containing radical SAM protein [Lachnospiraceae bacterium]|nr:B12-binding domain-containing radical SAM protein [Lachnospiraceae bacterium]